MCCYCCVERLKLNQSVIDHDAIAHRLKEDVVSCSNTIINIRSFSHVVATTKWKAF